MSNKTTLRCPVCHLKLYPRKDGVACKNFRCPLYHKMGLGWILSPSGAWFFQDTGAFRDIKNSIIPHINWERVLSGAYALANSKPDESEVVSE